MKYYTMPSTLLYLGLFLLLSISQALSLLENFQIDPKKVEEIENEILQRVITPEDGELQREVKITLVKFLVETTLNDYIQRIRGSRQDDGDADGVDGEQEQVYNGVRRLLQNVFSGNLIGVIQEGVGIRGPGRVQEFFSDVMGALFGSAAVKGAGTFGLAQLNATATPANGTVVPPGAVGYNPAAPGAVGYNPAASGAVGYNPAVPVAGAVPINGAVAPVVGSNSITAAFQNTNIGAGTANKIPISNNHIDADDDELDDF